MHERETHVVFSICDIMSSHVTRLFCVQTDWGIGSIFYFERERDSVCARKNFCGACGRYGCPKSQSISECLPKSKSKSGLINLKGSFQEAYSLFYE